MVAILNALQRLYDRIRCRYNDCREQHPVAREDSDGDPAEQITCPTCRRDMGIDPMEG